jgi:bifunctional non-homologous end joining protein LigD
MAQSPAPRLAFDPMNGFQRFDVLDGSERAKLVASPVPAWVEPMKAVLTEERFSSGEWIYERKLDGIRCLAFRHGREVRLLSRNKLSLNERFRDIASALHAGAAVDCVLDGEVVAFAGGKTSFERLQQRGERPVSIFYYIFDLLYLDGNDVRPLSTRSRKRLLKDAVVVGGPLRSTTHRNRDGEAYYAEACRRGWEGLIAKRADAPYTGGRSRDWLKFKCSAEQELVIGGFTAPRGSRTELGALLLGYYDAGRLRYAGKVGTGFTQETLRRLASSLAPLERASSPFVDEVKERHITWVEPRLVAQVGFSEWTRDGRIRHPRFLGLRDDKPASEVVRERPVR